LPALIFRFFADRRCTKSDDIIFSSIDSFVWLKDLFYLVLFDKDIIYIIQLFWLTLEQANIRQAQIQIKCMFFSANVINLIVP